MLGFTAALLIISTPQTVVTIPNPDSDIKHAAQFVTWSARSNGYETQTPKKIIVASKYRPFRAIELEFLGIVECALTTLDI